MSSTKNANLKNATNKVKEVQKESTPKMNLAQFKSLLDVKQLDSTKGERSTIYKYPDTFTKEDINDKKGKHFRSSLRTKLKNFSNNIFIFAKSEQIENLKSEVEKFNSFYKENYILQSYKIESITNVNQDKSKFQDIVLMLNIVNEVNANN